VAARQGRAKGGILRLVLGCTRACLQRSSVPGPRRDANKLGRQRGSALAEEWQDEAGVKQSARRSKTKTWPCGPARLR
jgi:hypothetical protein